MALSVAFPGDLRQHTSRPHRRAPLGRPAPRHLPPRRAPGAGGVRLRRLARRRRPDVVAGAAAHAARRPRLAVREPVGLRRPGPGCWSGPDAPVSAAEEAAFRERSAYWIDDWIRVAGPGALADQVRFDREWGALRAHAADRGVRIMGDIPFYVAPDAADVRAHPDPLPHRHGGRRAARRLHRRRPALGQPHLRLGRDGRRRRSLVDRAPRPQRRPARLLAHRPLPRVRVVVGGAPGAPTAREGAWRPGPGGRVVEEARAAARPARAGGGGPRDHHGRGPPPDGPPRPAGDARAPVRLPRRAGTTPTGPRTTPSAASSTSAPTTTTPRVGWWESASDEARGDAWHSAAAAGIHDEPPHRMLMRLALASRAGLAIVTAQDLLGLDSPPASTRRAPCSATGRGGSSPAR